MINEPEKVYVYEFIIKWKALCGQAKRLNRKIGEDWRIFAITGQI